MKLELMILKLKNVPSKRDCIKKYLIILVLFGVISEKKAKLNFSSKNALSTEREKKKPPPYLPPISALQDDGWFRNGTDTLDGVSRFHIPYHVSIQRIQTKGKRHSYEHLCAGTIIDDYYVMTAAHCFYKVKKPRQLTVVAGSNILYRGRHYNVTKIIKHDFYQPLMGRDIALLRIAPKFQLDGKTIEKISFKVTNQTEADLKAYLIGWGSSKKKGTRRLELVSFRTINMDQCRRRGFIYVSSTELCAISDKGRGACDGDSGGPLVNTGFNLQLGILSYGRKPCMRGRIYAFTKLRPLVGWIAKHLRKGG